MGVSTKVFQRNMCQCSSYDTIDDGTTHNELMADNTYVSPIQAYRTHGFSHNSLLSLTAVPNPVPYPSITKTSPTSIMAPPPLTEEEHVKLQKGLGTLYDLPRELRNTIYKHMITQGSPTIMATSSTLHHEVSETEIYSHGICRLNLNFYNAATEELIPCFKPSQLIVNKIRHVAIRVDTRFNAYLSPYPTPELDILTAFAGNLTRRGTCTLSFECWDFAGNMLQEDVLRKVHGFTGFEMIEVAVDSVEKLPNDDDEKWPEDVGKFSVQQMMQYSSKKEAMRTVWKELKRDMYLVEGGEWVNDRFTPMTVRPRRGLRMKAGLGSVDMGIGGMFCRSSLGDGGMFLS